MITRIINGIEIEINPEAADEIYFDEEFARKLKSEDITDILNSIYSEKNEFKILKLTWEITNFCNFNCKFCYINTPQNKGNKCIYSRFEELRGYIDTMVEQGLLFCTLSGGECLSHPDFIKIYEYLKLKGVIVTVFTNLSLLTDKILNAFKKYPPYCIEVSIYGMEENVFRNVTMQEKYNAEDILNNILKLKSNGFNVVCKTPINSLTQNDFYNIKNWCKNHEFKYYYSSEVYDSYDGDDNSKYELTDENIKSEFLSDYSANVIELDLSNKEHKKAFYCKAGTYSAFLSYDLHLRPCLSFYDINQANFNIKDEGVEAAIKKMKIFISSLFGTKIKYCKGCNYCQVCDVCIVTVYKHSNDLQDYMNNHCKSLELKVNEMLGE